MTARHLSSGDCDLRRSRTPSSRCHGSQSSWAGTGEPRSKRSCSISRCFLGSETGWQTRFSGGRKSTRGAQVANSKRQRCVACGRRRASLRERRSDGSRNGVSTRPRVGSSLTVGKTVVGVLEPGRDSYAKRSVGERPVGLQVVSRNSARLQSVGACSRHHAGRSSAAGPSRRSAT